MSVIRKIVVILGIIMGTASGETKYKAVFDITSGETKNWETLLNNLENVRKELKDIELKVVVHGGALPFLLKTTKFQNERMETLSSAGVLFVACENTMRRQKVVNQELYPFVRTVPAGVAEIIKDQQSGWAYIKIGH